MKDAQVTLTVYMMMIVALSTTTNLILTPILASRRDKKLAAGTAKVAEEAAKVATAVVEVKKELHVSKEEVVIHRQDEKEIFDKLQNKVDHTANKVDATHVIVNAQKTAMMRKLADSQLFTLTLAQAMLEEKPHNQKLKSAVIAAQALYDASLKDLEVKQEE